MMRTKVCLVLTAPTLKEDLALVELYRQWIDIAELRVDCLCHEDRLEFRTFPEQANIPCVLTVRRKADGGQYLEGEGARTALLARGLAFADIDPRKNFAYIDLEEDLQIPSIEEAARAFGTRIIRSVHNMSGPEPNLLERVRKLRRTKDEIAKIAFMPRNLSDVTRLFREAKSCAAEEFILIAMGQYGLPSRILAPLVGSSICYASSEEAIRTADNPLGHLDPITLNEVYNIRNIHEGTRVFGVTGSPLAATSSPLIHNRGYRARNLDAVYIPIKADTIEESIEFAEETGITGLSVTFPFKETVLPNLAEISADRGDWRLQHDSPLGERLERVQHRRARFRPCPARVPRPARSEKAQGFDYRRRGRGPGHCPRGQGSSGKSLHFQPLHRKSLQSCPSVQLQMGPAGRRQQNAS